MTEEHEFDPELSLAVVMGASRWNAADYANNAACQESAMAFYEYIIDRKGLGLPSQNVKSIIDDESQHTGEILDRINAFLKGRTEAQAAEERPIRDILFYYVGHGAFSRGQNYFLPVFTTRDPDHEQTSIRIEALANILKDVARGVRCHLIFDACFSATVLSTFLAAAPAEVVARKTLSALPSSGIGLLCSAGKNEPALAPQELTETMFTGTLLRILRSGDDEAPAKMSLGNLAELVSRRLKQEDGDVVYPHVASHTEEGRQIHSLPIFPNPAVDMVPEPTVDDGTTEDGARDPVPRPMIRVAEPLRLKVGRHKVTDEEWGNIPGPVRGLILGWRDERRIGNGAVVSSSLCVVCSVVVLLDVSWDGSYDTGILARLLFGMSATLSTVVALASLALYAFRKRRPGLPVIEAELLAAAEWREYDIVKGFLKRDAVPVFGGTAIGREYLLWTIWLAVLAFLVWLLSVIVETGASSNASG